MIGPTPDYTASIDFLRRWAPEKWWALTAVAVERRGILTETFLPERTGEVERWLSKYGADHNLYFHVNPTVRPLTDKGRREDVASLAWLHVDIDPRVGEDLGEEQARALRLLQNPAEGVPRPTVIVFSGGGYQGFWKLREPFVIDGDIAKAEEAKRWNLQLEIIFGADSCHNVDRIMRLPGTINRPDEKKRKKGRVPALAQVVEFEDDRVYDLTQFTQAPAVQTVGDNAFDAAQRLVNISGNVRRLKDPDDLGDKVSDRVKATIVEGSDPTDPTKHSSRSETLFWVCCELVRAGVEDDVIYAVITDPDFGISSSVLDKSRGAERYAKRQIERAREDAVDPWLRRLNERHAVIMNWGGKCRVVEEVFDPVLKRHRLTRQTFEDFRNRYMNKPVQVGVDKEQRAVMKPAGAWWLGHEHRREYDTIVFAPGHEVENAYNLWRGFHCEAIPGKNHESFLTHLRDNVCRGDEELFEYVVRWMARAVQTPDSPGQTALVFKGKRGTGKSFVAKTFGYLFGRHHLQVTDPKHLVGSFNSHLRDVVSLFADEAFYAGDKKHESILKMLVTEEMITVEAKGIDAEAAANCVHLMMASNEDWVVPVGFDERRFFVLEMGEDQMQRTEYFGGIQADLDAGGYESLLFYLMNLDLTGFDVRTMPKTAALQEQKILSMKPEEEWWFNKLQEGRLLGEDTRWTGEVWKTALVEDFIDYTRGFNLSRRGNATRLGHFLNKACPGELTTQQRSEPIEIETPGRPSKVVRRPYFWMFPTLQELRDHWDAEFGGPYDWRPIDPKGENDDTDDDGSIPF